MAVFPGVLLVLASLFLFVRNKDLIVDKLEYEDAGANSWVTSEAYLDEKRVDGGIV